MTTNMSNRDSLAKIASDWLMEHRTSNQSSADEQGRGIADAILAGAEWEYGKTLRGTGDNPTRTPSREVAESETDEWNHRIRPRLKKQGASDPGEGIVVKRVKAGLWVDVDA